MIRALRFFWIAMGIRGKTFTRRRFWFSRTRYIRSKNNYFLTSPSLQVYLGTFVEQRFIITTNVYIYHNNNNYYNTLTYADCSYCSNSLRSAHVLLRGVLKSLLIRLQTIIILFKIIVFYRTATKWNDFCIIHTVRLSRLIRHYSLNIIVSQFPLSAIPEHMLAACIHCCVPSPQWRR